MLYTQGAGIAPWHCLPICLDVGTDNQALLDDPHYLGWRHSRLKGEDYIRFMERFVKAFKAVYPNALCQWEDFSKQNAFAIRDAYLHELISFNDDIQGTGAVTLAAILTAMKIKGERLADQRFLIYGAGAGGIGIAEQIFTALIEEGLSTREALAHIFVLDSRGLITTDRTRLEPYKRKFAKDPGDLPWLRTPEDGFLPNVVKAARITVLIGVSGQGGSFTREIVESMLANTPRPVILPLSNPTANCEALPEDLFRWTDGRALVATGSPFAPVKHQGKEIRIGQCNNAFVFPGVGLGVLASGARIVLSSFFTAAAKAVSEMLSPEDRRQGVLMPPIPLLREVSLKVAIAVGEIAIKEGVSGLCAYSRFQHENDPERLALLVEKMRWEPKYLPLCPM
jgi:malate dehydrogenase (oxaloacetate-decarboxylating)